MDFLSPDKLTVVILLTGIIVAGYKQYWVWGYQFRAEQTKAEMWQKTALDLMKVADRAVSVTEKAVNGGK